MDNAINKRLPLWVIIFVIVSYIFLPVIGFHHHSPDIYYPLLTKSFLSGQISMPFLPSKDILGLSNPYDPAQSAGHLFPYDMSLYKGKYYLYFGILPVLTFFMPYKLLTGVYPTEAMATVFFLSLGFVAGFVLILKIREKYFPKVSDIQMVLVGLIMGFANNSPFLLGKPAVYEVAAASAFCFMSLAVYFLYGLLNNNFKTRDALLFSLCVSLSVAGRPHFALVCLFLIPSVFIYLFKYAPRNRLLILETALLVPALCVAFMLMTYNYLRFDSILEFGLKYQLATTDNMRSGILYFGRFYQNWMPGLFHYFFSTHTIFSDSDCMNKALSVIPFDSQSDFTIEVKYYAFCEIMDGYFIGFTRSILTSVPFVALILALPMLLRSYFKSNDSRIYPLLWFISLGLFVPVIIVLYLISAPSVIQRYETDFLPFLILFSIISLWLIDRHQNWPSWAKIIINAFFIVSGLMSIIIGLMR